MERLNNIKQRALQGIPSTIDEVIAIADLPLEAICEAADEVRRKRLGNKVETCSIINARSGRCSEDCKWCSQSRFHKTGVDEYLFVSQEDLDAAVDANTKYGVQRFSLVTSGRKVSDRDIDRFCEMYRRISRRSPIGLCASMGLLDKAQLAKLRDAGVTRYHCNLETSDDYFPTLCSTHTYDDKLRTIAAAREVGMQVCSGGIIGMGETLAQRLKLIENARNAGAVSMPINILNPIPGTALENTPLISERDIVLTVALARFIAPDGHLRFAGGRARLSSESVDMIMRGGMGGCMVGDLLTTVGNSVDDDLEMFKRVEEMK